MPTLITFIREHIPKQQKELELFLVQDHIEDAEKNIREAVQEFLTTIDGKEMIAYTASGFNWQDAILSVPTDIWQNFGLTYIERIQEITVNEQEVLCEDHSEP